MNWAIITGEHEWGDTFFKMEMQYDTGLIYAQEFFNIELIDDVKTVYSIKGEKLLYPAHGINIIKMKDGTIKKVFVKY